MSGADERGGDALHFRVPTKRGARIAADRETRAVLKQLADDRARLDARYERLSDRIVAARPYQIEGSSQALSAMAEKIHEIDRIVECARLFLDLDGFTDAEAAAATDRTN